MSTRGAGDRGPGHRSASGQAHSSLFGGKFDGPMPGHEPGMPVRYDLYAWVWRANPDGILSQFNPNVSCE